MKEIHETYSAGQTHELGKEMGQSARPGEIICLDGELGAGKSGFSQGFAAGLGSAGPVNSPTFTILNVYDDGRLPLYHFDVYRIEDEEEMDEIGADEFFCGEGVCLIEWAVRIGTMIPPEAVWVTIEKDPEKGFDYRRIEVERPESGAEER